MKVEDLAAAVRLRVSWEAADLGVIMVRHWWRQIFGPWLVLFLALLLLLLYPASHNPLWMALGVWLAKPVLDRLVLYVLSRALFGAKTTPVEALKATLKMAASWKALGETTLLRLRPDRALILPIDMLEGGSHETSKQRKKTVRKDLSNVAFGVSLLFVLFESLTIFGVYYLFFFFFPEQVDSEDAYGLPLETVCTIAYVVAVALLEPFFVGVNFSLHLNQRTKLEFWDLKIAFQQIRSRWEKGRVRSVVAQGVVLALLLFWVPVGLLRAQEPVSPPDETNTYESDAQLARGDEELPKAWEYREEARRILKAPPYNLRCETDTRWVPKWSPDKQIDTPVQNQDFSGLALILKWFFYGLAGVAMFFVVSFIVRALLSAGDSQREDTPKVKEQVPQPSFQAIFDKEALPRDILRAARESHERGELRKALSYLFRGALVRLADNGSLQLTDFATEGECIRAVKRNLGGELSVFFTELVIAWQKVAYGHRTIEDTQFETLCRSWDKHLGVRR